MIDVKVRRSAPDKGWTYYADAFEVLAPDGAVLGRRELLHPHESEQPVTRELHGVKIAPHITEVLVRARHTPLGYDGTRKKLKLPR